MSYNEVLAQLNRLAEAHESGDANELERIAAEVAEVLDHAAIEHP